MTADVDVERAQEARRVAERLRLRSLENRTVATLLSSWSRQLSELDRLRARPEPDVDDRIQQDVLKVIYTQLRVAPPRRRPRERRSPAVT
jgi:hypothetical protein